MGLCTQTEWTYPEFQFIATVFMSMATRFSDLDDQKPGINTQTEGHTLTQPTSGNGPEDPEAFRSAPSCSPSQSPARKPAPDQHTGDLHQRGERATPSPFYTWQVPVVEDMVWDGKAGLTEAVVTSPGRAVLFYGQQSLGEGLSLGEKQDAVFVLSGAISWVG